MTTDIMRVLHLISDPSSVVRLSRACDGMRGFDNAYVLLWPSLYHARECAKTGGRVKIVVPGSDEYRALLRTSADVIWVHGAFQWSIRFVLKYKGEARIAWSALGADYAGYIRIARWGTGLKPRLAGLFARYKLAWLLPSEHLRFFRRVDFVSIRDRRDRDALRRLLPATVRQWPFFYDSAQVREHEAAFILRTLDSWAHSKALGGTGTIRFDANGGVGIMPEVHCEDAAVPRLPANAFARKGYTFAGWSLLRTGSVMWGERALASGMPFVNGEIKLYALWSGFQCAVRFYANGGIGKMPAFSFVYGKSTPLPGNSFAMPGCVFKGWSQTADGKVLWKDRAAISEPIAKKGVADLFAIWSNELPAGATPPPGFYGIRFHSNDGTERSISYCFKYKVVSWLPKFSDLGWEVPKCQFVGWSLEPIGANVVYSDKGKAWAPVSSGKILDLYAIRCLKPGIKAVSVVEVKFDANGGNGEMLPLKVKAWMPTKLPECRFERHFFVDAYTFEGWALSPNGRTLLKDGDEVAMPPAMSGEITLYAKWKGFACAIVFNKNGGTGHMDNVKFVYNEPRRLPLCRFTRDLYVFEGWAASPQDKVIWKDGGWIKEPPFREGKVSLFARWRGARVRVAFNANGGEGQMDDFVFDYDPETKLPESHFSRQMRTCAGWSYSPRGPIEIQNCGMIGKAPFKDGRLTLYAQWRSKADKTVRMVRGKSDNEPALQHHLNSRIRILHIVGARLFVDGIISTFDRFREVDNHYILVSGEGVVYSTEGICQRDRLEIVQRDSPRNEEILNTKYDVVWLHGAAMDQIRYCLKCRHDPVIVWSTWGFDYVDYVSNWLYGLRTTFQWAFHEPKRLVLKRLLLWGLAVTKLSRISRSEHGRFFRKIDFFSTVLPEEELFVRSLLGERPKWIFYTYLQKFKDSVKPSKMVDLDQKGVWVGNSATLTNNYWDVFPLIAKTPDREVVVPLVYGTDGRTRGPYAEPIEKLGRKLFGDRFTSIATFLPLAEYTALMNRCSAFVFGHRRQQAAGNILIALRNGGCVFLDKRNPMYGFCLRRRFKVYTLDDLKRGIDVVLAEFKQYQKENVRRAHSYTSVKEALAKIHKSVLQVQGECLRRRNQNG